MKIEKSITLPCSGCNGKATFIVEGENPTFFHTMPYCQTFDAVKTTDELTKYMHKCAATKIARELS